MGIEQLVPLAGQFGPLGLMIGYLIWDKNAERRERQAQIVIRNDIDKAEIASRVDLARSLTMLSMVIQGRPDV